MERLDTPRWMHFVWLTCYVETIVICVWAIRHLPETVEWMMAMIFVILGYLLFVATPFGEDMGIYDSDGEET